LPCWAARPSGLVAAQLAAIFFNSFLIFSNKENKGKTPQMNSNSYLLFIRTDLCRDQWVQAHPHTPNPTTLTHHQKKTIMVKFSSHSHTTALCSVYFAPYGLYLFSTSISTKESVLTVVLCYFLQILT
jgi:hypothetical protein